MNNLAARIDDHMKLPYAARARVEQKKVVEYLLSSTHPDGQVKARFFSRFGFTASRWRIFAEALKTHGRTCDVRAAVESKFGTRYSIDGFLNTPDGRKPMVRTVWVLTKRSKSPRLVTAYPI